MAQQTPISVWQIARQEADKKGLHTGIRDLWVTYENNALLIEFVTHNGTSAFVRHHRGT